MLEKKVEIKLPPRKYSLPVEIFGRIWAFWALIVFVATLLVIFIPILITFLIPEPGGVKTFKFFSRLWMDVFLNLVGCRVKLVGKQYYDPTKNYVVTSNHNSLMDVPVMTPYFPGPNKTIAKKSFAKVPIFGWVYTRGSVLVDRSSDASRKKSFDDMKKVLLEENLNMALYPEGTRNRTGQPLKSFYDGAFKLAADCQRDIIPVVMVNTAKALPPGKFFFLLPYRLQIHLLPPVSHVGKTSKELKQEVYDKMWDYVKGLKQ